MIIRRPPKYPANCKKCKYSRVTARGTEAYCIKKGIFKQVKYFSCKLFRPKGKEVVNEYGLTKEQREEIKARNMASHKVSDKVKQRYEKRIGKAPEK